MDQVDLISSLLQRFTYLDVEQEEGAICSIADWIVALNIPAETIQVVATSAGDDADSGQAVLYALKPHLVRRGLGEVSMVNTFGRAQRYANDRPNIILVDEFVGTGRTIVGRLTTMIREFEKNQGVTGASFFVYAYAGMRQALDKIVAEGVCREVRFVSVLGKGISDHHSNAAHGLALMDELEQKLLPIFSGVAMPKLGDGQCEALYGRRGGNCPNSVFPVFWWPENVDGGRRAPLLVRKLP